MCGRFTVTKSADELEKRFSITVDRQQFKRRYNAAPGELLPVITDQAPAALQFFKWGLVPGWAKTPPSGTSTINARIETVAEKPSFKFAYQQQRCLVPADSYFEWKSNGKQKLPYRIMLKESHLFAFAGLWERWKDPKTEQELHSFCIITRAAVHKLGHIHDRMPIILSRINEKLWLDREMPTAELEALLQPPNENDLVYHTVSPQINKVGNDSPEVIKPHQYNVQGSLF